MKSTLVFLSLTFLLILPGCAGSSYGDTAFMMDTFVRIEAHGPRAKPAVGAAMEEIARIEGLMSPYISSSDIWNLNSQAGKAPVEVSQETIFLLEKSLEISRLSGGAFDVTIGPLVDIWKASEETGSIPSKDQVMEAMEKVGYHRLLVSGQTAFLEDAGMKVDLGAIAKGYAVDRAIEVLKSNGISSALVDAGGNVYVLGSKPGGSPWRVGIRHPRRSDEAMTVLEVRDISVVTSGDYQRYFEHDGVRYHHIIDPATGYPSRGAVSVTVLSESSTEADALSTALFVLGQGKGLSLAEELEGTEAIIVGEDAVVFTSGLDLLLDLE